MDITGSAGELNSIRYDTKYTHFDNEKGYIGIRLDFKFDDNIKWFFGCKSDGPWKLVKCGMKERCTTLDRIYYKDV